MEEFFRTKAKYENLVKHKELLFLYTKNSKTVIKFNLIDKNKHKYKFNNEITNISINDGTITIFFELKFCIYNLETMELSRTFVFPGTTFMLYLSYEEYIFVTKFKIYYYKDGSTPIEICHSNLKIQESFLILQTQEDISIYKYNIGCVYRITKEEIKYIYLEPGESLFDQSTINQGSFCIRNRKLYMKSNDRIFGSDLNVYLDKLEYDGSFNEFQSISGGIVLFNRNTKDLEIFEKNLHMQIYKSKCFDYFYDDEKEELYLMDGSHLRILKRANIHTQPFELITNYYIYEEQEDEFDESQIEQDF